MNTDTPPEDLSTTVPDSWRAQPPTKRGFEPRDRQRVAAGEAVNLFALAVAVLLVVLLIIGVALAGGATSALGIILIALGLPIYFLPSLLAWKSAHRNTTGIVLINIFLGWTLLGWVGALVWAVYEEKK